MVRFVKSFRSDAGGLASLGRRGLSVGHRRTRFARPPIGVRRDRLSDGRDRHTLTIKTVPNDQSGSVRKVLSVRHRRPRFARPPIGVRRDRLSDGTGLTYSLTHTIKSEDLTPFLRNWSFRINWSADCFVRHTCFAMESSCMRQLEF